MYEKAIHAPDEKRVELDFPGVSIQVLDVNEATGAMVVLTTLAPGAVIPEHWHTHADESVYVLAGDFNEAGIAHGPGTFFLAKQEQAMARIKALVAAQC